MTLGRITVLTGIRTDPVTVAPDALSITFCLLHDHHQQQCHGPSHTLECVSQQRPITLLLPAMRRQADYIPLRSSPNVGEDASNAETDHSGNRLVIWACIGAICSSVLSFVIFAYGQVLQVEPTLQVQYPYGKALRRPNPYVNLDKVLQNSNATFPPITNFPPIVLQIDAADTLRRTREDHRQWRSHLGTVYPDDRRIIVSAETSTIVQFRNIDYAMEHCVLTASIPRHTEPHDPAVTLLDPTDVDIWMLDMTEEMSPHIPGTWERAARRRSLLATMAFSREGQTNSTSFHCASNEYTTLELSCASSENPCLLDFWQDQRAKPRGGFYMTQYQTPVKPERSRRVPV